MNKIKKFLLIFTNLFLAANLFCLPFNKKLTVEESEQLENGEVIIRNIGFSKNICLENNINESSDFLLSVIKKLEPKYLAEVIQVRPYDGNEDLPEKLLSLLNNVSDYAGIPYFSEKNQTWYDLYTSAKIVDYKKNGNITDIKAVFDMNPFGLVNEDIQIIDSPSTVLYTTVNKNKLRYFDKFDCVGPEKMSMCILLFKHENNWILYGIGGVNAPRIPLFTERIQTSFINRINTFCAFIFNKI